MIWFQNSISKHLHHHTFFNMFFNEISKAHCIRILSCFNSKVGIWFIARLIFPTFQLSSLVFSTTFHMWFGLPHFSITNIFWCMCTHPINLMDIHLLHYIHGNKHTGTNDANHNTFVVIVCNVNFHVGREQLHVFLSTSFNSSRWQINIVFTKYGICTLTDIVITNLMWLDLLPWSCTIQRFVAFDATQAKERSYCNWHLVNQFFLLTIEVFGYLHKHADMFLHDCANAIWNLKRPKGFHFFTFIIFLCQKI